MVPEVSQIGKNNVEWCKIDSVTFAHVSNKHIIYSWLEMFLR